MIMFIVLLVIVVHMSLIWLWYRNNNNPSVVDVGWASGLTLSGLIYLNLEGLSQRSVVLSLALLIWGLRLGGYMWWTRIRPKHIDKRYQTLSSSWKMNKSLGFLINFQLQGVFIFIVSSSWYLTSLNPAKNISLVDVIGLVLFILALILETTADLQLQRFKKEYPGLVCNQKLWALCRHPNYFFEWLIWCSFSLFALPSPYSLLAISSPLALYSIMHFITIPFSERVSLKSKKEHYMEYQGTTPEFFPKVKW
jgi:steroid 5-alpha reductase family enzyme